MTKNYPPPEVLDHDAARLWSKERINAEIASRKDELRDSEQWVSEM